MSLFKYKVGDIIEFIPTRDLCEVTEIAKGYYVLIDYPNRGLRYTPPFAYCENPAVYRLKKSKRLNGHPLTNIFKD